MALNSVTTGGETFENNRKAVSHYSVQVTATGVTFVKFSNSLANAEKVALKNAKVLSVGTIAHGETVNLDQVAAPVVKTAAPINRTSACGGRAHRLQARRSTWTI